MGQGQHLGGSLPWCLLNGMERFDTDTLKLERPPFIPPPQMGPLRIGATNAPMYQVKQTEILADSIHSTFTSVQPFERLRPSDEASLCLKPSV